MRRIVIAGVVPDAPVEGCTKSISDMATIARSLTIVQTALRRSVLAGVGGDYMRYKHEMATGDCW